MPRARSAGNGLNGTLQRTALIVSAPGTRKDQIRTCVHPRCSTCSRRPLARPHFHTSTLPHMICRVVSVPAPVVAGAAVAGSPFAGKFHHPAAIDSVPARFARKSISEEEELAIMVRELDAPSPHSMRLSWQRSSPSSEPPCRLVAVDLAGPRHLVGFTEPPKSPLILSLTDRRHPRA